MTLQELAKQYAAHDAEEKRLAELKKANDDEWSKVEAEMIEIMINDGVPSIRLDDLGLFSIVRRNYLSVNAANKPMFFEYLQGSGNGGLLKLDVHSRTLESFLKGHVKELTKTLVANGEDEVEAREKTVEFLKQKGAAHFSDTKIQMRKA